MRRFALALVLAPGLALGQAEKPTPATAPPPEPASAAAAAPAAAPVAEGKPPPSTTAKPSPAAFSVPPAARTKQHRVIVTDFVLAGAAHPELARVLSDAAAIGGQDAPDAHVMAQSEISALLGIEKTKMMMGCSEEGCMAEIAGALDADRVLSGSLTLLERTALVTVKYVDARKARTLSRTTGMLLDATQAELVDAARRLAHEAVTGERLDTTGTIKVRVDRKAAEVTLDGKSLGETPLAGAQRVQEGPHTVTVQKPGFVRWSSTLAVAAGRDVLVDAELVPIQLLGESSRSRLWTWGWVSAGAAVASGTAAVIFGNMARNSYDRYKAATTRTAAVDLHDETQFRSTLSNVSWGVAAVSAVGAGTLLTMGLLHDARAAAELSGGAAPALPKPAGKPIPSAILLPTPGGATLAVTGSF